VNDWGLSIFEVYEDLWKLPVVCPSTELFFLDFGALLLSPLPTSYFPASLALY